MLCTVYMLAIMNSLGIPFFIIFKRFVLKQLYTHKKLQK